MDELLLDHVTIALIENERELYNDLQPRDYYEVKAEAAIQAIEEYQKQAAIFTLSPDD